jgi:transcriptional regulator with XRE-family HTH domain
MRTIDMYCDEAIARNGFKSDSELARKLGFTSPAVSNFRTKRAWPSDEVMVKLAAFAGIPADEALLELAVWRTHDTIAGEVYAKLLARIAQAACLAFILLFTSQNAQANQPIMSDTVYYG